MSNYDDCQSQINRRVGKFFAHCEKMKTMKEKAQMVVQDFDTALDLMKKVGFLRVIFQYSLCNSCT